jgi:hypothetical protein
VAILRGARVDTFLGSERQLPLAEQASEATLPSDLKRGWSRVRVNVKKDKLASVNSRQLTGHMMSLRRNMPPKDPSPEEAAEAYAMLVDARKGPGAHSDRQRKKEQRGASCLGR